MGFLSAASNSVGDLKDMVARLRSVLPLGWFPSTGAGEASNSPVLDGVLAGLATGWAFCYDLLRVITAQARLGTATGDVLDLIAQDFFAAGLPRKSGEQDGAFRLRIVAALKAQRGTRADVSAALTAATGVPPFLFEPRRGSDCGGIGGVGSPGAGGGSGYGCPGLRYGSSARAFQYLVSVPAIAGFAPGVRCVRSSPATFIDSLGAMRLAPPDVLRPDCRAGSPVTALIESRACNLIKNSQYWAGFSADTGSGGGSISWSRTASASSLLAARPVLSISVNAAASLAGPSILVAAAGAMVTCSAWVMIEQQGGLTAVELVARDLGRGGLSSAGVARIALPGLWQRVVTTLQLSSHTGLNLQLGLRFSSAGGQEATVLTQCWQVEPGARASSHIPTEGFARFREADWLIPVTGSMSSTPRDAVEIFSIVAASIPVATIAWSNVVLPVEP